MSQWESEADFQRTVTGLARRMGWAVFHTTQSTLVLADGRKIGDRASKGFPDLVLVREVVLFRELKTDKGRTSPEQVEWINRLEQAGANVAIWRPAQFDAVIAPALARWHK